MDLYPSSNIQNINTPDANNFPQKKGISMPVGVTIIIVVAVLALGGAFVYQYIVTKDIPATENALTPVTTQKPIDFDMVEPIKDQTASWTTYANPTYGYQFKYPANFSTNKISIPTNVVLDYTSYGQNTFVVRVESSSMPLEEDVKQYVLTSKQQGAQAAAPLTVTYKPYTIGTLSGYLITEQASDVLKNTNAIFKIKNGNNIFSFVYSYQGYIFTNKQLSELSGGATPTPEQQMQFQTERGEKLNVYDQIRTMISTFTFTAQ